MLFHSIFQKITPSCNLPKKIGFWSVLIILVWNVNVLAQNRDELEAEKARLQKEIEETQQLLRKTQKEKKMSVSAVAALQSKIERRQLLIQNINSEISDYNFNIEYKKKSIDSLNREFKSLKENYAKLVFQAYKTRGKQNSMIFLLSAGSFNEAFKRYKYLKSIAAYRQDQAEFIVRYKNFLRGKISELELVRRQREKVLLEEKAEKETLEAEKTEKDRAVADLKQQEKGLKQDLDAKKRARERLNAEIQNAIRREIDAARKREKENRGKGSSKTNVVVDEDRGNKSNSNNDVLSSTPESMALSNSFAQNRGALPWPVESGVITGFFGERPHPTIRGVKVKNNGIDIKTYPNSSVRAVFEGTVISIVNNPVFKNAVIIRHGSYFTVYSNLESVSVSVGEKVDTKQTIGRVYYNDKDDRTEVHFEVWQGSDKMNPSYWIKR